MASDNAAGNVYNRRARRKRLLARFPARVCAFCRKRLTEKTVCAVRFPQCPHKGGKFTEANTVMSCLKCAQGAPACEPSCPRMIGRN